VAPKAISCYGKKNNATINIVIMNIQNYKPLIRKIKQEAIDALLRQEPIQNITKYLVKAIDTVLIELFEQCNADHAKALALVSTGGYGRRELQLYSDIDLLILHAPTLSKNEKHGLERFVQCCWDIGLEISHQITTPEACSALASEDLSIISSLLDRRLLCGNASLLEELDYLTHPLHMWDSQTYFIEKRKEQEHRYEKYNDTAYNLEPNIKNGPGGLRDIHILIHIAKRHFKITKLSDGILHGFLTEKDYEELIHCRQFLWRVRFALHWIAQKKEDKLMFDYQIKIAPLLGYQDTKNIRGIELFMKNYFKIIKRTRELNDILLQWFNEAIIFSQYRLISLDHAFQLANQHIEVKSPHVFQENPGQLMALFLWIARQPDIQGVRANTIRLIHQSTYLINEQYRQHPQYCNIFLEIFKFPNNPYHALHHMSRYGVLSRYLPCFQQVIGQMQYDLFHIYTVDQHALFVIRNLTDYQDERCRASFPLCTRLIKMISKPEILYLSALFHDIAKGRGGDHSELGAEEALAFSLQHHLKDVDQQLLVWLVRHHLLMSHTAQRKDIYDIRVIADFCHHIPHSDYLDYLYLLTVADICATNPKLWNTWKDALLQELYYAAKLYLHQDDEISNNNTLIKERQAIAQSILSKANFPQEKIHILWSQFDHRYFIHAPADVIAAQTQAILTTTDYPILSIQPHHSQAAMELFVYMPHQNERFAIITAILSNAHVTIQEAHILTNKNHFDLDTYVILDEEHPTWMPHEKIEFITQKLKIHLRQKELPRIIPKRVNHLHAHFSFTPRVTFQQLNDPPCTQLLLITSDRPGLLAHISQIFLRYDLHVHHAKIATAGERAEDTFSITNSTHQPLSLTEQEALRETLLDEVGVNHVQSLHEFDYTPKH
jgi:[protein-PII] uridylyltransferase